MVTISSSEGIDIFEDLKTYFSPTEWNQLADAEKIRYNNIMKNHLCTPSIDMKSVTPDFMRRDKTSEGVKEEKEDERSPSLSGGHNETVAVYPGGSKSKRRPRIDNTEQIVTSDHNYFRKPSRTDATELIVPEDHHYCDQCKKLSLEECKVHGPPVFMDHRTMANRTPPPPRFEIRQSGIPDVGRLEGFYRAKTEISVRTDICPYEGVKTDREEAIQSGYSCVVSEERNNYNYIAKEQTQPYCMSYVNCANNETEQNMMAFQCVGVGELLLVSRGDEYPKDLAIVFDMPWDNSSSAEGVGSQSSPNQVFSCSECQYSFNTQVYLHKHMKSRHNDLYCQMLRNGQIPSAQQITSSLSRQKQGSPCLWLVTDEPGSYSQLFTKTLTQAEVKTHGLTEKKAFLCKQCDRGFCQLGDLNRHQRIHTGEKPYQCTQCDKSFSQLCNLRRHENLHTGEKHFHCKHCGKSFHLLGHLKTHLRIHTGEKPYRCKHCHKSFTQSSDLKKHQRSHTGEKPFHCKQCNKCFNRLDTLKTHQRIHTGEKPFHCKQCDKSFSQLANLKSHERLHTGEKPFHCKLCDRSFSQLGVLNRHQRRERAREIHGQKPFPCRQCDKSFSELTNLKSHERLHAEEKPFHCEVCDRSFSQLGKFNRHQRRERAREMG